MFNRDPQDFAWLLRQIKQDYRVIREKYPKIVLFLGIDKKENLIIYQYNINTKNIKKWKPNDEDIFAEDYEICKKNKKSY